MPSTGQIFPTTAQSIAEAPWSDNTWTSPTNVLADDGTPAEVSASTFDGPDQTFVLKAYIFDFSTIPDGATIKGVTARINAYGSKGSLDLAQLLNISRAKVGTNQASTPIVLPTADTNIVTLGGPTDLWGNALTPAWVKNTEFGIALGCLATGANADVFVDYVTLEIEYTEPPILDGVLEAVADQSGSLGLTLGIAGPVDVATRLAASLDLLTGPPQLFDGVIDIAADTAGALGLGFELDSSTAVVADTAGAVGLDFALHASLADPIDIIDSGET